MDFTVFTFAIGLLIPAVMFLRFPDRVSIKEAAVHVLAVILFMFLGWQVGRFVSTGDHYYVTGQITGKERDHGTYLRSYSCNCRTSGKSTTCSTCYERHYTVTWTAESTVGSFTLDHRDSTWRSVYDTPDPDIYLNCKNGQPATDTRFFTNYVRAVDQSLFSGFTRDSKEDRALVPMHPQRHDVYQYSRIASVIDKKYPEIDKLLNEYAKSYGKNGANPIVVVTDQPNRSYRDLVERKWRGGKINDIVIIVSVNAADQIQWVDAFSYGKSYKNQEILVGLKNYLTDLGDLATLEKQSKFAQLIGETIKTKYEITTSKDFEYLKHEVQPHPFMQWFLMIAGLIMSGTLSYFFHRDDIF